MSTSEGNSHEAVDASTAIIESTSVNASIGPPSVNASTAIGQPSVNASTSIELSSNHTTSAVPAFSPATEEILKRVSTNANSQSSRWEAAREHVLKNIMTTSDSIPKKTTSPGRQTEVMSNHAPDTPTAAATEVKDDTMTTETPPTTRDRGRGRGGGRPRGSGRARGVPSTRGISTTPRGGGTTTTSSRGRGQGQGKGRGRGRGRGGRGGRKNADAEDIIRVDDDDDDDDDDEEDNDSDHYTPQATATRSGRAVQKPTAFVPTIPSPVAGQKRKRGFGGRRRNPESTVCSVCHRPHSPAMNMIVFCDDCNTPFHRYCHHPPIPQSVVDIEEEEWRCSECATDRGDVVQEPDVDTFVAAQGLSQAEKRQVLSLLPSQTLITLLLRANALRPDLPLYPPGSTTRPLPTTLSALLHDPNPRPNNAFPTSPSSEEVEDYARRPPDPPLEDDDPAVGYPRSGFGLGRTLPPEEDDLAWLVDGNEEVYSHLYRADAGAAREWLFGKKGEQNKGKMEEKVEEKNREGVEESQRESVVEEKAVDETEKTDAEARAWL